MCIALHIGQWTQEQRKRDSFILTCIHASMVFCLDASDVCVMPDSHCVSCSFGSQTLNCALRSRGKCQSAQQGKEREMVAGSGRGKEVVVEEKMPWVELVQ